jgi:hypothetical protein
MTTSKIPPMTLQLWLANTLDVAETFAYRENQESRWLASDSLAWERPEELINCLDDVALDEFMSKFVGSFSEQQVRTIHDFRREVEVFCNSTPAVAQPCSNTHAS